MQRITAIELEDRFIQIAGEPLLDTDEGVLVIEFGDGRHRTFNWDHVVSFYYMTEEESAAAREEN
ncbi:hypothetical protein SEA_PHARAOH_42 [Mycobacterium phage Pharaoh]|uniref:Uncharacterized protein n=1 Tax=Mycobacterium phage Pharaoh TaxID=2530140 RepID=A0A481W339_9CAUD|nr:hypothetical protein KIV59_gp48 [Mycobacterium phage Pharaoh]QBJ00231.1 hypothetical protein SEA_PHARAOH_42 [Mycobacterium phage Pharaoh]